MFWEIVNKMYTYIFTNTIKYKIIARLNKKNKLLC